MKFFQKFDRWLIKQGFKLKQPLLALYLIEMRRTLSSPIITLKYLYKAKVHVHDSKWKNFIPKKHGYKLFGSDTFPELKEIVNVCDKLFKMKKANSDDNAQYNKRYFFNILTTDDLIENPILIKFALSQSIITAITDYFGRIPRLHSIGIFYSPVNDTIDGSQMYHVDGDAVTQIKCFINIWHVDHENGPLTFLPKYKTSRVLRNNGLMKTLRDDDIIELNDKHNSITMLGPPGSGGFVDTSRCLHQGSRTHNGERLVFQFQYVPIPDTLIPREPDKKVHGGHIVLTQSLIDKIHQTF